MGLLTFSQRILLEEFSQVLVYESSNIDKDGSSDDGQNRIQDKAKERAIQDLICSKSGVDQRFINMLRV